MGLAASHARLCMLTLRKSDVEGRLMHIANKKLSLARDSERISEEYNNGLNATLLTYNTGASDVPVTYNLLMSPTTQCMLTNANGAVVLDDSFCAALGITGGKAFGDKSQITTSALDFVNAKANTAYTDISQITGLSGANSSGTPGTQAPATTVTKTYSDSDIFGYLNDKYQGNGRAPLHDNFGADQFYSPDGSAPSRPAANTASFCFWQGDNNDLDNHKTEIVSALDGNLNKIISDASEALKSTLGATDSSLNTIMQNAKAATLAYWNNQVMTNIKVDPASAGMATEFGTTQQFANGTINVLCNGVGGDNNSNKNELMFDPNQVIKMFLNFFDAGCKGDLTSSNASDYYKNNLNTTSINNKEHVFFNTVIFKTDSMTRDNGGKDVEVTIPNSSSTTQAKPTVTPVSAAVYYYNLYQQICNGWARDNNVDSQDYLQGMVQHGNYGIKQYQNGKWVDLSTSSPDSPLNVTDDTDAQKKAEAKYDAEKDKINFKEKLLDVEQNSADTERQAVTTEIDSVKKLIDKNMDAFKLFQQG